MTEIDMLKSRIAELQLDLMQTQITERNAREMLAKENKRYKDLVEQNANQAARIQSLRKKCAHQGLHISILTDKVKRLEAGMKNLE